jgi:hypothetical protein
MKVGKVNRMRIMNLRYTNKKKVRGAKRKSCLMVKTITKLTSSFPEIDSYHGYWHMHLPVSQIFIDSIKTPTSIRRLCIQTLIDRISYLIDIKNQLGISAHVVACISLPNLWNSQITVFFDEQYFSSFFERNNEYQKWIQLPKNRNLEREWSLVIPNNMNIRGFNEILTDDDYNSTTELWFVGNLD